MTRRSDFVVAADFLLRERYGITLDDAGVELGELDQPFNDGWTAEQWVEWFALKHDLDRVDTTAWQASPLRASAQPRLRIVMRGGLVQSVTTQGGRPVRAEVCDYDCETSHPGDLRMDTDGESYLPYEV